MAKGLENKTLDLPRKIGNKIGLAPRISPHEGYYFKTTSWETKEKAENEIRLYGFIPECTEKRSSGKIHYIIRMRGYK